MDPVDAYDCIASGFEQLSDLRRTYLAAIEQLVISEIPPGSESLLDIGAGDGCRALRIAQASGIKHLTLLEPSAQMRKRWPTGVNEWGIRAEELSEKHAAFDVLTCLWNVLGHISPAASRIDVMRHCARLLSPQGRLFVDLNYRYNASHYGLLPTTFRTLQDLVRPGDTNGDVTVSWTVNGIKCSTNGHVFTYHEFRHIAHSAGLTIEKQFAVNYSTGKIHRSRFAGNPLFILRRA